MKTRFGYGLHVIADVEHEIPVWFAVTAAAAEQPVLSAGVDGLFAAAPALADRCADFCADRGLDGGPLKRKLWDAYGVRPLVDVREMWREEKREPGHDAAQPILRSPAADGGGNVLHSEKGEVSYRCPATGEVRPMAFQGFEADRGTLKYRCPAAAYGLDCKGRAACLRDAGSKAGDYGRVVRVELASSDRRMFTPTPWGSPSWKRGYNRRGALERINARLDGSFGFECHFVRGGAKMTTRLGLAVAVMMALALGAVLAGRPAGADALAGGPGPAAGGLTPPGSAVSATKSTPVEVGPCAGRGQDPAEMRSLPFGGWKPPPERPRSRRRRCRPQMSGPRTGSARPNNPTAQVPRHCISLDKRPVAETRKARHPSMTHPLIPDRGSGTPGKCARLTLGCGLPVEPAAQRHAVIRIGAEALSPVDLDAQVHGRIGTQPHA